MALPLCVARRVPPVTLCSFSVLVRVSQVSAYSVAGLRGAQQQQQQRRMEPGPGTLFTNCTRDFLGTSRLRLLHGTPSLDL